MPLWGIAEKLNKKKGTMNMVPFFLLSFSMRFSCPDAQITNF
jgi:hypothetical protein